LERFGCALRRAGPPPLGLRLADNLVVLLPIESTLEQRGPQ
jgi:hypothetical protein